MSMGELMTAIRSMAHGLGITMPSGGDGDGDEDDVDADDTDEDEEQEGDGDGPAGRGTKGRVGEGAISRRHQQQLQQLTAMLVEMDEASRRAGGGGLDTADEEDTDEADEETGNASAALRRRRRSADDAAATASAVGQGPPSGDLEDLDDELDDIDAEAAWSMLNHAARTAVAASMMSGASDAGDDADSIRRRPGGDGPAMPPPDGEITAEEVLEMYERHGLEYVGPPTATGGDGNGTDMDRESAVEADDATRSQDGDFAAQQEDSAEGPSFLGLLRARFGL
jgi:hypothetical protein